MIFVLIIKLWALVKLAIANFGASTGYDIKLINAIASSALVVLALYLTILALVKVRSDRRKGTLVPAASAASLE